MTDIEIITTKRDLYLLCMEILSEFPTPEWTLSQSVDYEAAKSPDLRIWDYHPGIGLPEDVAAVVAFLASAGAGYVTGQAIHVDGGLVI